MNDQKDPNVYQKNEDTGNIKMNDNHQQFEEETAAEYTPNPGMLGGRGPIEVTPDQEQDRAVTETEDQNASSGKRIGILALILSIVSLFFLPVIMAVAGIILGAMAVRRDQLGIGYTAMGIGAFALIVSLFFAPFTG